MKRQLLTQRANTSLDPNRQQEKHSEEVNQTIKEKATVCTKNNPAME